MSPHLPSLARFKSSNLFSGIPFLALPYLIDSFGGALSPAHLPPALQGEGRGLGFPGSSASPFAPLVILCLGTGLDWRWEISEILTSSSWAANLYPYPNKELGSKPGPARARVDLRRQFFLLPLLRSLTRFVDPWRTDLQDGQNSNGFHYLSWFVSRICWVKESQNWKPRCRNFGKEWSNLLRQCWRF